MYCKNCKKHTGNMFPKKIVLISNNKIKGKSKCAIYLTERTFIHESEDIVQKVNQEFIFSFLLTDVIKEHEDILCEVQKRYENIDPKMVRTENNRLVMQSKCPVCGIKKSRFVKEQEAKGLLSNLGIKTPLSKIPLLNVLF